MPIQPSYPGVYVEEIASGVHTIVGVPTSIAAFVGTAPRGPDSEATPIGSLLQYERTFGRTDASPLGISVRLFFQNGGAQALVVRVTGKNEAASSLSLPCQNGQPPLVLTASSKGAWGAKLAACVDYDNGADGKTSYNLTLREEGGRTESYKMLSADINAARSPLRMLKGSALVTVEIAKPAGGKSSDKIVPVVTKAATAPQSAPADAPPAEGDQPATAPEQPRVRGGAAAQAAAAASKDGGFVAFAMPDAPKGAAAGSTTATADDYVPATADSGAFALMQHDAFFNLLVVVPPGEDDLPPTALAAIAKIATDKRAFMIVDAPGDWTDTDSALKGRDALVSVFDAASRRNAALYFPRLKLADLGVGADPNISVDSFPPAGAVAGLFARTDTERGLWKAPAGIATGIGGTIGLTDVLADFDSGQLNPVAINGLRSMPIIGNVVWGARTLAGSDLEASEWKYIPVRRLALYIEESLYRGTQWVVFEPNDEPLWAQIRLNVGAFMHTLFRQGAFQGTTAREAYFVKCDHASNPQEDIDRGIVNIIVGFAPLKPAEFVIIQLQQIVAEPEA